MRKLSLLLLSLLFLAGQSRAAHAQEGMPTAELSLVDAQGFPAITALLDVYDAQGLPVTGLGQADVTLLEDNQPHPVGELVESAPPAQIAVAINPGPALAVRDGQGKARFEYVTEVLAGWAGAQPVDEPDDLSLVSVAGPIITHAKPSDWVVSLTSFQPDFRSTTPNIQSLMIALNTVNEPLPMPGMKRAILLITPHMDEPDIDLTLQAMAEQALASKVRVFVWFVDADLYFNTPSATAFKALALQTGGNYFAFSGLETFPDLESYFSPLRHLYSLSYNSTLTSGEEHTLAVQVQAPGGEITSESKTFSVDIQPPNPIMVTPPEQIVRQAPADDPFNTELLLPERQPLEIIIEFPDDHPRPLARTTLYVDGTPVAQNDAEPFEHFVWDLSAYNESGQHELVAEAVDSLGLSKTSMSVPVVVTVIHAPTGIQALLAKYRTPIAMSAIALAGGILLLILLSGRLRIKSRRERRETRKRAIDPVTQPVNIQQAEPPSKRKQAKRPPWRRGDRLPDAPAYLARLGSNGEPLTGHPIALIEKEITFGTDPVEAMHVLDHPSIAALHARIQRKESGDFWLFDNGTVAGTWVNYEPVPQNGCILKHEDVVNFGQLMYRFTLKNPPAEPEPKIISEASAK